MVGKNWIFIGFLILMFNVGKTQHWRGAAGFYAGPNLTGVFPELVNSKMRPGFNIGCRLLLELKRFDLITELGYSMERTSWDKNNYSISYDYIELPIRLRTHSWRGYNFEFGLNQKIALSSVYRDVDKHSDFLKQTNSNLTDRYVPMITGGFAHHIYLGNTESDITLTLGYSIKDLIYRVGNGTTGNFFNHKYGIFLSYCIYPWE